MMSRPTIRCQIRSRCCRHVSEHYWKCNSNKNNNNNSHCNSNSNSNSNSNVLLHESTASTLSVPLTLHRQWPSKIRFFGITMMKMMIQVLILIISASSASTKTTATTSASTLTSTGSSCGNCTVEKHSKFNITMANDDTPYYHNITHTMNQYKHTNRIDHHHHHHRELRLRIIGGKPVGVVGQYPFYGFPVGPNNCGLTVVWADIGISAAHCKSFFISGGVFIGGIHITGMTSKLYGVLKEVVHPGYDPELNGDADDILVMQFNETVTGPYVTLNDNPNLPIDGTPLTVIGHGSTNPDGYGSSYDLMSVTFDTMSYKYCNEYYGGNRIIDSKMICAGTFEGGADSCQGDSGGPLFLLVNNNTNNTNNANNNNDTATATITSTTIPANVIQVGLVSFGDGCGKPGSPSVNTRISYYKPWIEQMICTISNTPPPSCNNTDSLVPPMDRSQPPNHTNTNNSTTDIKNNTTQQQQQQQQQAPTYVPTFSPTNSPIITLAPWTFAPYTNHPMSLSPITKSPIVITKPTTIPTSFAIITPAPIATLPPQVPSTPPVVVLPSLIPTQQNDTNQSSMDNPIENPKDAAAALAAAAEDVVNSNKNATTIGSDNTNIPSSSLVTSAPIISQSKPLSQLYLLLPTITTIMTTLYFS